MVTVIQIQTAAMVVLKVRTRRTHRTRQTQTVVVVVDMDVVVGTITVMVTMVTDIVTMEIMVMVAADLRGPVVQIRHLVEESPSSHPGLSLPTSAHEDKGQINALVAAITGAVTNQSMHHCVILNV